MSWPESYSKELITMKEKYFRLISFRLVDDGAKILFEVVMWKLSKLNAIFCASEKNKKESDLYFWVPII